MQWLKKHYKKLTISADDTHARHFLFIVFSKYYRPNDAFIFYLKNHKRLAVYNPKF